MTCDHTIGQMFGDKLITFDEALEKAKRSQYFQSYLKGKWVSLLDFVDGRKGYMYRFEYCPHCGTKVDWVDIRRKFKEEQEI